MIDVFREELLTLRAAARRLPDRPHLSTVWRWVTRGVGPGRRRLETVTIGGRRYTSTQALGRFIAELSSDATAPAEDVTDGEAADAAEQELERDWGRN